MPVDFCLTPVLLDKRGVRRLAGAFIDEGRRLAAFFLGGHFLGVPMALLRPLQVFDVAIAEKDAVVGAGRVRRKKAAVVVEDSQPPLPAPEALESAVVEQGVPLTPLDYMLAVLRSEAATASARMEAAKNAAPYVHARLASAELKGAGLERVTDALSALIGRVQADGGGVGGLLKR